MQMEAAHLSAVAEQEVGVWEWEERVGSLAE